MGSSNELGGGLGCELALQLTVYLLDTGQYLYVFRRWPSKSVSNSHPLVLTASNPLQSPLTCARFDHRERQLA